MKAATQMIVDFPAASCSALHHAKGAVMGHGAGSVANDASCVCCRDWDCFRRRTTGPNDAVDNATTAAVIQLGRGGAHRVRHRGHCAELYVAHVGLAVAHEATCPSHGRARRHVQTSRRRRFAL
ncbi:hypothetical protein H310_12948 [Aphanomyces invadans]|uniref:Uncharacterized protein n=1 Tax=Aphanomyces invadans TaxID=157072 RepID=A0A024THA1_9STRA|nr:hypothetical protein H310_12948 [Aphanomyces invadans]ETV92951.1 hypothetical protein H310_12948 [Aphanomyces invadans]|eukprot:XP_008878472.1 hypothetical protein H310_12948 [Aphanomyces invadans]